MTDLATDVRNAIRQLRATPGLSAAAIGILAVGIALAVTIFSVVQSAILERLPYPAADRLVGAWERSATTPIGSSADRTRVAPPVFLAWRGAGDVFEEIAAYSEQSGTLVGAGDPRRAEALAVSASMARLLGDRPVLGRPFTEDDDRVGAAPVALLTHRFWIDGFGARRDVIGRSIELDGTPYEVIGVTSPDLEIPGADPDLLIPLLPQVADAINVAGAKYLIVLGRLRPGITLDAARDRLDALTAAVPDNEEWRASLVPLREQVAGDMRRPLLLLFGGVIAVLLIACANVSNLLLSRVPARIRDLAIRNALGASRGRLIRQVTTEALVMSVLAAGIGLLLAWWGRDAVLALSPESLPRRHAVDLDIGVLAFTGMLVLLCMAAVGLTPALLGTRVRLADTLRAASDTLVGGRRRRTIRRTLLVAEIALTALLICSATLLVRSFATIVATDPGFRTERITTFGVWLAPHRYAGATAWSRLGRELSERVRRTPGVVSVAATNNLPISGRMMTAPITVESSTRPADAEPPRGHASSVSADFFRVMNISLVRGRWFTERDAQDAAPVAIISESLAHELFPGEDPIGRRARSLLGPPVMREIVGVVADVHQVSLTDAPPPVFYTPLAQAPRPFFTLIVRSELPTDATVSAVRTALRDIDPELPLSNIATMRELIGTSVARPRFLAGLVGVFAVTSFALTLAGVYAVMASGVAERRREIAIRIALGAQPRQVRHVILREALGITLLGLAIGIPAAVVAARSLRAVLHGVSFTDPLSFLLAGGALLVAAAAGTALPARRAARLDPVASLRV
ncbi:MAG TPA: ABC transporter permease [Longimicrobiales bacterium]